MDQPGPTREFGFLPIPKRCRYDPANPFIFSSALNVFFAFTAMITVAVLYYPTPLLVQMSETFEVSYETITRVPSLLQAGYLIGLVFVTPLADLVPRRALLLTLITLTATLSIGLATVKQYEGFLALNFLVGIATVVPQILVPLAADLAPPERRARCVGIVLSGLMSGLLFGRVIAGIIARYIHWRNVYWLGSGLQYLILFALYWVMPAYPRKTTNLSYFQILWSMVVLLCTQPILQQACLVTFFGSFIFVSWWNNLTFLLSVPPFEYDVFEIGLFGLTGIVSISLARYTGMMMDSISPWVGSGIGVIGHIVVQAIATGGAGISLGPVIIGCICTDLAQQAVQLGNQARIFTIDPLSRGRINGVSMLFAFIGQTAGSSAGPKIFLRYGWRVLYGTHVAFAFVQLLALLYRGPHAKGWAGWSGIYSLRREVKKKPEEDVEVASGETAIEEKVKEQPIEGKVDDTAKR